MRDCEWCGRPFAAARSSHRFCSASCRWRSHQAGGRGRPRDVSRSSLMVDAVHGELRELHMPETDLLAVEALILARDMDVAVNAAAVVASSRLLSEVMDEVRKSAGRRPPDPDELQARRHRRPRGISGE
jgi:hypothetical protein